LQVHFELAGARETPLIARVAWVYATEAHRVKFGVACIDMEYALHNRICDFLLVSRHWSPARLRDAGFRIQKVKRRLRFRTVKTMADYAEVLYLRRDAYVGAGKKPEGTPPEAMAGKLDGKSRIFMAWHDDDLVGSLTFTYPDSEDLLLDSQAGFPDQKYPVALPPKIDTIEVSRLCIHAEYRSTDLLQGLFEHGMQHFLTSNRRWLLTSAVTDLLPLYRRIGFKTVGASYLHPGLNNIEHHLLLAHRDAFLLGKGVNALVWLGLFGEVLRFLRVRHSALLKPMIRWRLSLHLWTYPLVRLLIDRRLRRAFKAYLASLQARHAQRVE
jgi:predicted GNAT family N-acyltransferase